MAERTEQQDRFLEALFGDADGNYRRAMDMAGYSKDSHPNKLIKALKAEIIERAEHLLAVHAPKAVLSMTGVLDDPSALGNREMLAAAGQILDRAGVVKTEKVKVESTGPAILILPPLAEDPSE